MSESGALWLREARKREMKEDVGLELQSTADRLGSQRAAAPVSGAAVRVRPAGTALHCICVLRRFREFFCVESELADRPAAAHVALRTLRRSFRGSKIDATEGPGTFCGGPSTSRTNYTI
ncbi:hypothetical protein EYF80_032683 [Liparis tanakae]|uniref:Uncharacterized protein n=1 Tax=Liparis tanakae TaxID=230148 RepID=A0A4Z2GU24_9TELE|nr:hypothetical protein EYF80_032683 [Liparis tanakae]